MKKQTTIKIIRALILILIVFGVYSFFQNGHKSVLGNSTIPVTASDIAVKVFLQEMIPHHQEAVDTSMVVMQDVDITNPEVRKLAANIVDAQSFEITQMKSWHKEWFAGEEYSTTSTLLKTQYVSMMSDMSQLKGDALAKAYLKDMITHHEHAIMTADEVRSFIVKSEKKNKTSDGELTITNSHPAIEQSLSFMDKVVADQTKEVEQMKALLEQI